MSDDNSLFAKAFKKNRELDAISLDEGDGTILDVSPLGGHIRMDNNEVVAFDNTISWPGKGKEPKVNEVLCERKWQLLSLLRCLLFQLSLHLLWF